jgi:hypothetical protein
MRPVESVTRTSTDAVTDPPGGTVTVAPLDAEVGAASAHAVVFDVQS